VFGLSCQCEGGRAMPPPGYEPFLRAICDNPADDTVRLAFADWLDENGEPERAAFIRASIEWSRVDFSSDKAEWMRLRERVTDFVKRHGREWLAELPDGPGLSWDMDIPSGPFDRGFPAMVAVLNRRFLDVAERVFALAPVEHLVFARGVSLEVALEVLSLPCADGISDFTIVWTGPNQPGDELCEALAGFTHLRRLEWLALSRRNVTDRGAAALARASFLPQLRYVMLEGNAISEAGVLAVTDRLAPERVRHLTLPDGSLSEPAIQRLRDRFGEALQLR
jgi:uncharacterized protein (TIGR02996 family)